MKRYEQYKDSGIEWIGEIPTHWEIKPIKYVTSYNDEVLGENTDKRKVIRYVEIADVEEARGIINQTEYTFEDAPSRARRITRKGDVIISTVRTYLRAIAKVEEDGLIVSTGFIVLRSKELVPTYLSYISLSDYIIQSIIAQSQGVSYPAINASDIVSIKIPIPPIEEQRYIAEYLDTKCGSIDSVIASQERRIALLSELKQSIITEAVTRGINADAPLKDSGIEWIGKIPAHWEICRFKNFVNLISDASDSDNKIGLENIESNTGKFIQSESDFEGNGIAFKSGDVVYGKLRPYLRKVWLAEFDGNAVGDFFVFRCASNCDRRFLQFLMLSDVFTFLANSATNGVKMPRVSSSFILTLKVGFPPLCEQVLIANHIINKVQPIDAAIGKAKREIELLREFKQSVITEAVTGKIKVY